MDGWLIGTGTYAGLAVLTFLPVLRNVIRGVRLHSGGASFDDAKHFSADAKQRLKQHYSRMQGTLGFWKKHAETYRYLHYYSLCWAIPSSLAIPILTQSLSATDVWSKILLTVISTHSALVLTFHRALKVDANYKAFRQGESEFYDLYRRLLDRPNTFGANEEIQLNTYFDAVENLRKFVRNAEIDNTPAIEQVKTQLETEHSNAPTITKGA